MVLWDERILEILLHDEPSSAAQIASRNVIHVKQGQVSGRLKRLGDHGYIEQLANGVYGITTQGVGYLCGEYDANTDSWAEEIDNPGNQFKPPRKKEASYSNRPPHLDNGS